MLAIRLQLTAVGDHQLLGGRTALRAVRLDLLHDVQAGGDLSEDDMLAIQPRGDHLCTCGSDEEREGD